MTDLDFQQAPIPENMSDATRLINKLNQQNRELRTRNNILVGHINNKNAQLCLIREENLLLLAERRKMIERSSKIGIDVQANLEKVTPLSQFKLIRDERKRMEKDDDPFQHHANNKAVFESIESSENVISDTLMDPSFPDEQVLLSKDDPLLSQDPKGNRKQLVDQVTPSSSHTFDHKTIVNSAMNSYGMEDLNLNDNNWYSTVSSDENFHPSSLVIKESYLFEAAKNYDQSKQNSHAHNNEHIIANSYTSYYNEESDKIQSSFAGGASPSIIAIDRFVASPRVEDTYFRPLRDSHLTHSHLPRNELIKKEINDDDRGSKYLNMEKSSKQNDFNTTLESSLPRTDNITYESPKHHDQQVYTSPRQTKTTDSSSYRMNDSPRWVCSSI